jgi:DNA-binding NtrC family response regulator
VLVLGGLAGDRLQLARAFHREGRHHARTFVRLHCGRDAAQLSAALHDFLSAPGAPAGNPIGDSAGGTLFLDSIAALPPAGQRLLLELALRTPETPAGSWRGRLVIGNDTDLYAEVEAGRFLGRLYDCLDKLRIELEAASA